MRRVTKMRFSKGNVFISQGSEDHPLWMDKEMELREMWDARAELREELRAEKRQVKSLSKQLRACKKHIDNLVKGRDYLKGKLERVRTGLTMLEKWAHAKARDDDDDHSGSASDDSDAGPQRPGTSSTRYGFGNTGCYGGLCVG